MDDIFDLAIAKKMFGGGKREGTAVPADKSVERIYFNTANTREQTNALLSQLTYIEGVMEYPMHIIYANSAISTSKGWADCLILALKDGDNYMLEELFMNSGGDIDAQYFYNSNNAEWEQTNGWYGAPKNWYDGLQCDFYSVDSIFVACAGSLNSSAIDGIPIGAENEKIKNVLSITPF